MRHWHPLVIPRGALQRGERINPTARPALISAPTDDESVPDGRGI
jgi:hypothetical protein